MIKTMYVALGSPSKSTLKKEIKKGQECGVQLENYDTFIEGDVLQAYSYEDVPRSL